MMKRATITGYSGRALPNLEAFGFKWKPARKLLDEQADLWRQMRENGSEIRRQRAEIRDLDHANFERRSDAVRKGEAEPSREEIERAKERLKSLEERERILRRAGEKSYAELERAVIVHRDDYAAELEERAESALAEAEEAAEKLRQALRTLDNLGALREWVAEPERGFSVNTGPLGGVEEAMARARRKALRGEAVA
jgi:chromosome segregation ATPase